MFILNRVKESKEEKFTFLKKLFLVGKEALLRIMKALHGEVMGISPGINATMRVVERV